MGKFLKRFFKLSSLVTTLPYSYKFVFFSLLYFPVKEVNIKTAATQKTKMNCTFFNDLMLVIFKSGLSVIFTLFCLVFFALN